MNDSISTYLEEIGRIPLLTAAEEIELGHMVQVWQTWEDGPEAAPALVQRRGRRARERMMKANLRLVVSVAKKFQNRGIPILDLIQEGNIGLARGVEKFDPTRGYKFSTYGYWWIRQSLTRAISQQANTIRLPLHAMEALTKIRISREILTQELCKEPTLQEIATKSGVPLKKLKEVVELSSQVRCGSLDDVVSHEGSSLIELVAAPEESGPSLQEDMSVVGQAIEQIGGREMEVVRRRFMGTDSLTSIAKEMGCSRERIRQLEARGMRKLAQKLQHHRDLVPA